MLQQGSVFGMKKSSLQHLGPLAPVIIFYISFLITYLLSRVVMSAIYLPSFEQVSDFFLLFPIGVRIDTITLSALLLIPVVVLLLFPKRWEGWWKPALASYFTAATMLLIFLELASYPFMENFAARPNGLAFQYLDHPGIVFAMIIKSYWLELTAALLLVTVIGRASWNLYSQHLDDAPSWSYRKRLLAFPLVMLLLVIGVRSSFGPLPANPSIAIFSNSAMANELALNSFYSLAFALHTAMEDEIDPEKLFSSMEKKRAIDIVQRISQIKEDDKLQQTLPSLHTSQALVRHATPPNVVIIVAESMSPELMGSYGGESLTPNFDRLAERGLFFSNLYSTGARTINGLESLTTGFYPTPSSSVIKLNRSQNNFFTIARLLKQHGYATDFIYGGDATFDNMAGFFLKNGFDRIIDQKDYHSPQFEGVWGVADEDVLTKANETFRLHTQPFVSVVLTMSNHLPFDFPEGRIEAVEQPLHSARNAIKYADYALGKFFAEASKEYYFDNTLFLVVADHSLSINGDTLMPINEYRIPGILFGKGVKQQVVDRITSQADLLPTLIALLGIEQPIPTLGRNVLTLANDAAGRAILRNQQKMGYLKGDQLVVHEPYMEPQQFRYQEGKLFPVELDNDLQQEALAHILAPYFLYRDGEYRLP